MLAQLCDVVVKMRSMNADEKAAHGELVASHLSEDLVRVRLPALNRQDLAWRALDDLLVLHCR
jgi:hypothetical protein